nr:putative uncharacterized protein C1orf229 homolog [Meriones unguiculatus]
MLSNRSTRRITLAPSPTRKGSLQGRDCKKKKSWKVASLQSCGRFPPRPSSDSSLRPPRLLPAARQRAGAGGLGSRPSPLACWGPRLRRLGDRGVHQPLCQRRRRAASPTPPAAPVLRGSPLLLALSPRPPPPSRRAPRDPAVLEPRAALPKHRPRGAGPAPSPSPVGAARPRGREQGGETGSSPPAPPLSPPGAAGRRPCPTPASPPRHTGPAKAAIRNSPALGQSTSGPQVHRAPPSHAGCRACATPASAHALSAASSVLDVWKEPRCTEMFTA